LTAVHTALAIVETSGSDNTLQGLDAEYLETLDLTDRIEGWQSIHQNMMADSEA